MSYEYVMRVTCDYCGVTGEVKSDFYRGEVPATNDCPDGWGIFLERRLPSDGWTRHRPEFHYCLSCKKTREEDKAAEKQWQEERALVAKGQGWGKLLPWVKKNQIALWEAEHPVPGPIARSLTDERNGKVWHRYR